MTYTAAILDDLNEPAGTRPSGAPALVPSRANLGHASKASPWQGLWGEVFRTEAIKSLPQTTAPMSMTFAVDMLPIVVMQMFSSTAAMIDELEQKLGANATDTAKMLRVSRPMVYHYRDEMEPSVDIRRRLQTLAGLASEAAALTTAPLKGLLKAPQAQGRTLLECLSSEVLDVPAARQIIRQSIADIDRDLRTRLATALARGESAQARGDIARERRAEGKPIYVGDPDAPGKLIQIRPDGSRVRGRMVKRQFVPDE